MEIGIATKPSLLHLHFFALSHALSHAFPHGSDPLVVLACLSD